MLIHTMHSIIGHLGRKSADFYLKEHESLRKEVELVLKDYRALERNIIILIAGAWGWLLKEHMPPWTYWAVFLFAILGAVRAYGVHTTFVVFHDYLTEIERAFFEEGCPQGWEHFTNHRKTGFSKGSFAFWTIVIVATFGMAIAQQNGLLKTA
jgi:hypothetical protein